RRLGLGGRRRVRRAKLGGVPVSFSSLSNRWSSSTWCLTSWPAAKRLPICLHLTGRVFRIGLPAPFLSRAFGRGQCNPLVIEGRGSRGDPPFKVLRSAGSVRGWRRSPSPDPRG